MKYYLLTILFSMLALFTGICHAQSIYFNDKGQVFGNLPNKLETGSKLTFEVSGEDLGTAAQKQISERAKACKTRILAIQKDPDIMEQLKLVYQITPDDLKKVLTDMDAIDKASQSLTYIPAIDTSISHYQLYSKDISLTFDLKIHSNVPFEYNKPGWTLKYPNQNLLNLQLSRNELFKKSVYNWYAQTRVLFHTPDAGSLSDLKIASEKAKPVALAINAILQKRKNYLNSIDTLKRYNQQLDVLLEKLDKLPDISLLSENKNWVLKWLWHGGEGMPKLNPFDFISDTRYELPDTSGLPAKRMEVFTKENF
ncbi:hypothetical protein [Pedobacter sp. P26]|uniref:hypothetical protein n=1 Tax=Pedobacter sp. P26 TaxID=3423956 RepID=UPI003D672BFB